MKDRHDFSSDEGVPTCAGSAGATACSSGVGATAAAVGCDASGTATGAAAGAGAGGAGGAGGAVSVGGGAGAGDAGWPEARKAPVCCTTTRQFFAREVKDTSDIRKAPATSTKETQTTTRVRKDEGPA